MKEITQYKTNQKYFLDLLGNIYNERGTQLEGTTILTVNGPKTMTRDKWVSVVYFGAPTDVKFFTYKNYLNELKWSIKQVWKPNSYCPEIDDFRTTYIYFLCDKKDGIPRYVGKTDNPKKRLGSHKRESINKKRNKISHKENWIRKVYESGSSVEMIVIDEVIGNGTKGSGDWTWVEEFWGQQLTQWGFPIIFDGGWGTGGNRRKRTQDEVNEIRKIQADVLGIKCFLYDIYNKTYLTFDANKQCVRYLKENGFWDCDIKTLKSDTTLKGKFLFSYTFYTWDEVYNLLLNKSNWEMSVLQFDINFNNIISEYPSLREAQRQTGVNNIAACLNKNKDNRKSAAGYRWVYKLDYIYLGIEKIKEMCGYKNKGFVYTQELINDCLSLSYKEAVTKYKGIVSHGTIGNIRNNPNFYVNRIGQTSTTTIKKNIINS
jgi:hypothetical protein